MPAPVVRAGASLLFHAPGLVRHGSKPSRDLRARPSLAPELLAALRPYKDVLAYAPNQTVVGNLTPWELQRRPRPWFKDGVPGAVAEGPHGVVVTEEELYGWLLLADAFHLIAPRPAALDEVRGVAAASPLFGEAEREALGRLAPRQTAVAGDLSIPFGDDREFGSIRSDHADDASLFADVLLENVLTKATAAVAVRWMLDRAGIERDAVDYVISTSEDAVGDRYQRGGGNLAKAVAELAGCRSAGGADVKDFCAGPLVGVMMAASLVQAGVFRRVAVVGGGSLAKLGMKSGSHLAKGMPVLEDVLAATAVLVTADDGVSPVLRLDSVATARVADESSPIGLTEAVVGRPLRRLGLRYADVDRYVGELHNPEVTGPAGGGDVPDKNYRMIAACAVAAGELGREQVAAFVADRGVPGFAPTQGHVASAACFMPHAVEMLRAGVLRRALFVAKASCFLGRMTQLQDAVSFLLEARA
jgi:glycine/sarcosine/betaine reductase complex component C subunit beta